MTLLFPLCFLAMQAASQEVNPHANQDKIDPARIYEFARQELTAPDFPAEGLILDIGGGGAGIIGRVKGAQVVAIDLYAWGMRRTPAGPLKVVMDATDLKFLDESFGTVTSFFTLMYMDIPTQTKALQEARRVLKPAGRLRIWDVELPVSPDPKKDLAMYPFRFRLPSETVDTGYGTPFPKQPMGLDHYVRLVETSGFTVDERQVDGHTFRLVARKK